MGDTTSAEQFPSRRTGIENRKGL